MNQSLVMMGREEYEHFVRAVIVFDHIRARNEGRSEEVTALQQRLLDDAERFDIHWTDEERDRFVESALKEVDAFVGAEAWDEFAWWIAEREYQRRARKNRDAEAKDLLTHRYYHETMEEFGRHGIEHLEISDLRFSDVSPETVRAALAQYKQEGARRRP